MILKVNPHKIELIRDEAVNEREIDISKCQFEFSEEITNDYVKEAYFTFKGTTYKQIIANDECAFPSEVLAEKGDVKIGVVAYLVENETEIKRFNPSPVYFDTWYGSLVDNAENSEPITPSEMEQFEQALNDGLQEVANVDIDAEKIDDTATISITNRQGETKSVEIKDGQDGEDGQDATINGENVLNIVAGDNVRISQEDSTLTISATGGGSGGTSDYTELENKPSINGVTLNGNKTTTDLGINIPDVSNFITKDVDDLTYYTLATDTGATIELNINSSTYEMTLNLKNSNGTTISTDSVDLPLETMVVGATYDNTNKKIILELKNGTTLDVPVGDLVSGLQAEITSQNKLSSDLVDDTNNTNKFVTSGEKTTWNAKQDELVSGTNIKTINNESIVGSGNLNISGSVIANIGSSYTTDLSVANVQEIIDKMYAANTNEVYLLQNATGYRSTDYCMASIDNYLAPTTTSCKLAAIRMTPHFDLTRLNLAHQLYDITLSWNDNVPTVESVSKRGGITAREYFTHGNTQSWTPNTNYSPVHKKYVTEAIDAITIQYKTMPTASSTNLGKIVQYTGATTNDYTNGYFYICVSDGASTPTYSWENLNVQQGGGSANVDVYYLDSNDANNPLILDEVPLGVYIPSPTMATIYVKATSSNTSNRMVSPDGAYLVYTKKYSEANNSEAIVYTSFSQLSYSANQYVATQTTLTKNTNHSSGLSLGTGTTRYVNAVSLSNAQTINGLKTFSVLPQSSVAPTNNDDLVNKKYVDDAIAQAIANL